MLMYQVVFEYVSGPSKGLRFRTTYLSKEEFASCDVVSEVKVVSEGLDDEEGLRLCQEAFTPSRMVSHALGEAARQDGSVDLFILAMELQVGSLGLTES